MIGQQSRSPYLGAPNAGANQGGHTQIKKRGEKGENSSRKKESMLANANLKTAMLSQNVTASTLNSQQIKTLTSQANNNAHTRTKSQSKSIEASHQVPYSLWTDAGSVNLKLQSMQNY